MSTEVHQLAGHVQEPVDLRLAVPAAGGWLGAWWAVGVPAGTALLLAVLAAASGTAAAALTLARRRRADPRSSPLPAWSAAALALALAGGAASAGARTWALDAGPLPRLADEGVRGTAVVELTSDPRLRRGRGGARELVIADARLRELRVATASRTGVRTGVRTAALSTAVPVLVLATDRGWLGWLPGQRLVAEVRLAATEAGDRYAALLLTYEPPAASGSAPGLQRVAGSLREGLREAVGGLDPPERGLVPGLVVGDDTGMPVELEEAFRTTGLTHLTAVSGANVMIVLGFVLLVARWAGVRGRGLALCGLLAVLGFLVLARPEPSVVRATGMALVVIAAMLTGRRRVGVPALSAAVLVLVLVDPWLSRSYGFALSTCATAALLLLAPPWARALTSRGVPLPVAVALAVPAAAQAACAPLVAMLSEQVSLVAVPANLLVAPAVAPTTVLGLCAAAVSPVSPAVAGVLGQLAGWPAAWIVLVAQAGAQVPGATVPWPGTVPAALLLAAAAAALAALPVLARAAGRRAAGRRTAGRRTAGRRTAGRCAAGRRQAVPTVATVPTARAVPAVLAALAVLVVLVVLVVPGRLPPRWPPEGWLVVACDVGQGDALVVRAGPASAMVVDAGPDPGGVSGCLDDLGVDHVPLLVLTHFHADHAGGVEGVLDGRTVDRVVVSPLAEPAAQARRVARAASQRRVAVEQARPGTTGVAGRLRWTVLAPGAGEVGAGEEAANDASVVVVAEVSDVRILLTGDLEPLGQRRLLGRLDADADGRLDDGPVDVLKVPHHGSAHQLPELYAALAPRVALVSAGEGNDYGHPAPDTLALLRSTVVLRTDTDGDVAVVGHAQRLGVVRRDG